MCLACRSPRRWGTGSTTGPTARTMRSTTSSRARIRRRPCTTLGAMCLTGRWRPSVRLQMGMKSALVSAVPACSFYVLSTSELIIVRVSWQTLGHIVTVSFFFGAWRSVAGFDILMPVCSDGVPEPRRVRGVVVYCECLWRSTLHMLIYVLLPDQGHQARHRGYPNLLAPTLRRRRCKCVYLPNAETRPTCFPRV